MALRDLIEVQGLFPDPALADGDGLLAYGGSLSPEYLIEAYGHGIFPWFSDGEPILWWSPDPRMVLFPADIKISRSLQVRLKRGEFSFSIDKAFPAVIRSCARVPRRGEDGTWIGPGMIRAYNKLHRLGIAHSFESWKAGRLVGGLYGVAIGRMFFGESMFHLEPDASKAAMVHLCRTLDTLGFTMIDAQIHTAHLESLGARLIPRQDYLELLAANINREGFYGSWTKYGLGSELGI